MKALDSYKLYNGAVVNQPIAEIEKSSASSCL